MSFFVFHTMQVNRSYNRVLDSVCEGILQSVDDQENLLNRYTLVCHPVISRNGGHVFLLKSQDRVCMIGLSPNRRKVTVIEATRESLVIKVEKLNRISPQNRMTAYLREISSIVENTLRLDERVNNQEP